MPETFRVVFNLYHTFFENTTVLQDLVRDTWLSALRQQGGTPVENTTIKIAEIVRQRNGLPLLDPTGFWDTVRVVVEGQAYRPGEYVTLEISGNPVPFAEGIQALLDSIPDNCSCDCEYCVEDFDDNDLDTFEPARPASRVPQREDDLGEDPEAHKYPWTDAASWYPEYLEED